jgi:hypothetical protein
VREEDAGGREAGAHSTTPTYTVRRDGPAREPSLSAFWLQKPSILRACVREEDTGGREVCLKKVVSSTTASHSAKSQKISKKSLTNLTPFSVCTTPGVCTVMFLSPTFPRTRECRAREVLLRWPSGPLGPRATGEPGAAPCTRAACAPPASTPCVCCALSPLLRAAGGPRCARRGRAPRRFATRPSRGAQLGRSPSDGA